MKTDKTILIGKYLSGNASPKEEKEILDWVKESSSNEEEFNRIKEFWKISRNLKSEKSPDIEKAWQDFKVLTKSETNDVTDNSRFSLLKIAAAITLFAFSFILVKYFAFNSQDVIAKKIYKSQNIHPENIQKTKYITCTTNDSALLIILPDSSRVQLNKHSQFVYPEKFNSIERSTSLSGEAFFEISHNKVPFVILCKQTKTTVLGTSFNIKGYENDKKVTVTVVTGTVQFSDKTNNKTERVTLKANERGVFDNDQASLSKTNYSDKEFVWWKKIKLKTKIKRFIKKITGKN